MDPKRHLPLSPRDFLILLVLSRGERHGYGIAREAEASDGDVRLDPANLYRALKRLTRDGLVEDNGERPEAESDGAPRRYYALTSLGRSVLTAEAERLAALTDAARAWNLIPDASGRP